MAHSFISEKICCLTTRSWSTVFAWIQIIGCAIGFVVAIVLLATMGAVNDFINTPEYRKGLRIIARSENTNDGSIDDFVQNLIDKYSLVLLVFNLILLCMSIVGFIMGGLLHYGVSKEKPKYLTFWIILTALSMIAGIAGAIAISAIAQTFKANSIIFLGNIFFNIFSLWIVEKHRRELEENDSRMSKPVRMSVPSNQQP